MNPFSQLIGVSLIMHFVTIVLAKRFSFMHVSPLSCTRSRLSVLVSVMITLCVAWIVLSIAVIAIIESFKDPHSNIWLVSFIGHELQDTIHVVAVGGWAPSAFFVMLLPFPIAAAAAIIQQKIGYNGIRRSISMNLPDQQATILTSLSDISVGQTA